LPRVTIIIPSYNHERFLGACLESVRAQTFQDWEAILLDDGSSDGSLRTAREFAKAEPRFKVHQNEKNLGTYGTEQKGLEMSRGELIAILNSDDFWTAEKLAAQVELLDRHPEAPYCYVLGWLANEEGKKQDDDIHERWPREELQEPLPHLLYENRILASSVLFRKSGLRFETTCRYSGDWVALLERSLAGPALCAPGRLSYWRIHGSNTSIRTEGQLLEEIRVRRAILENRDLWFVPRLPPPDVWRGLATNSINLQALYVLCGLGGLARKEAARALRWHPEKRVVLKRCLASLLPASVLRRKLWKGERFEIAAAKIEALPKLQFCAG
jgi:glycosyltransferase involved in cell wall biosynthesis